MADKTPAAAKGAADETAAPAAAPARRSPGHRGADVPDTVAEMAAKAHEISMEAGSKMSAAVKDIINAAAGLTTFAVESALFQDRYFGWLLPDNAIERPSLFFLDFVDETSMYFLCVATLVLSMVIVGNLLADILNALLDPRVRLS